MKTSELIGTALDYAVANCEGGTDFRHDGVATCWIKINGKDCALSDGWAQSYQPSTNWSQGGPIIEREHTEFDFDEGTQTYSAYDGVHGGRGETHLIAAMRCYVASKLGDEVEVPNELTQGEAE